MIAKHKLIDTKYHSLYGKRIYGIKERYNYKTEQYESLWAYEYYLFRWDNFLKKRKVLHAIVFNKLFFWKKPIFRVQKSTYTRYRLYVGDFHNDKKELDSLFYQLRESSSHDILELIVNSNGGSIDEGQQFFNLINGKFYQRTIAYLDNHGYSMGAILFCMIEKRIIYPYSVLMFHNYSSTSRGKGGEIKAKIEHSDRNIGKFIHDIIVKKGFFSEEEFQKMLIGQDYWMDSQELCRRGIATHVIVDGKEIDANLYLTSQ